MGYLPYQLVQVFFHQQYPKTYPTDDIMPFSLPPDVFRSVFSGGLPTDRSELVGGQPRIVFPEKLSFVIFWGFFRRDSAAVTPKVNKMLTSQRRSFPVNYFHRGSV